MRIDEPVNPPKTNATFTKGAKNTILTVSSLNIHMFAYIAVERTFNLSYVCLYIGLEIWFSMAVI